MYLDLHGELKYNVGLLSVDRSQKLTRRRLITLTEIHVSLLNRLRSKRYSGVPLEPEL